MEVVFYNENTSQFDQNFKAETGFSMDSETESENAPFLMCVPSEKLIRNSLYIINELV